MRFQTNSNTFVVVDVRGALPPPPTRGGGALPTALALAGGGPRADLAAIYVIYDNKQSCKVIIDLDQVSKKEKKRKIRF